MPIDAPDGTLWFQQVEPIGDTPVPVQAATEDLLTDIEKVTTSSAAYQTLLTYTVPPDTVGVIYGLELYASDYSVALFKLTVKGVVKWEDKYLPVATNLHFTDARLAAGSVILLEVKSNGSTSIAAFAAIEGKELS